jgi:hypothetical protein
MTESLFLINPRRKRRRKGKMPAGLARYWASRRGGTRKRRRKAVSYRNIKLNPRRRKRRHTVMANPRRRRRRAVMVRRRSRRRNPIRAHRRRHRRHNPFSMGGVTRMLKPAAIGAAGAIGASIAYGYLAPSLPASLTSIPYFSTIAQAAAAIGVGLLVGKFMSRQDGQYATMGGLTVVLVGAITPLITQAVPTLPGLSGLRGLGRTGDYVPYARPGGMGAYMRRPNLGRLGFYSPAAVLQPKRPGMGAYMARSVPGMADLSGGSGYNGLGDNM